MPEFEPGTIFGTYPLSFTHIDITAVEPVSREQIKNYVAQVRQVEFLGAQVPANIRYLDAETGETIREEHIPGCATCSI